MKVPQVCDSCVAPFDESTNLLIVDIKYRYFGKLVVRNKLFVCGRCYQKLIPADVRVRGVYRLKRRG